MSVSRRLCVTVALILSFVFVCSVAYAAAEIDSELKEEIKTSIDRGLRWLRDHQGEDGSYGGHAGITALVATAFMRSPRHYTEDDGPFVKDAIKFIVSKAEPDGAIYDRGPASYITAVALMALLETKNPEYKEIIENAKRYLMALQLDEAEGLTPDDRMYGGVGYGMDTGTFGPRGDLSNLHFSLEALKKSGVPEDAEVWGKAIKFIERCQNRSESNDQPWAGDDGGFIYHPAPRSEDESRSYGSMTYAGVESFIYANVDKDDERVKAAVRWIKDNYTLDENPPIGARGLYYYYHTMAKAFAVYGEPVITDSHGVQHNWYEDLARKLLELQKDDGSWVNEEDRWMESMPTLVTAYAVLALSIGYPE
jgi:squalene-hopene/tetraprenyl-beta-curcumene cyclase